ncbi:hypothetical protein Dsin_024151 [Dipteronia sinensis]|uniref:Uncharacterized protein n=1 Tax=Dipteronia sinensis TaxID=43782 RepID=A0AAE0A692_9ROSI|nr:hypothetical protein Dsin_024151 [Dipteronia sinensis]
MKIDVEVISREIIKPSTTLPQDHYKFSHIDKMNPGWHIPLIYFYSVVDQKLISKNEISNHLKTSLSQVLSNYYPLVGNVKENFIDCKNGGVLVLDAQVNCLLSEFLQNPNPDKFVNKFLPEDVNDFVLAIQLNFFNCGGIAIGVCVSHKVADASSMITFIKNWAVTAHGGNVDNVRPKFVGTTLFPTKDGDDWSSRFSPEKNITLKRFVFTNSNISALKEKYVVTSKAESSRTYPSRYKTLSSFLWSRYAASTEIKKGPKRSCLLISPINLRKMTDPPLSDDSFGNGAGVAISIVSSNDDIEDEGYNYGLVSKLTVAISKLNKDFVKKLQNGKPDLPVVWEGMDENTFKGELVYFTCSSFCRFPIYEADFGWGRPVWCAAGAVPCRNCTILIDTKNEDGIEAWVHLTEEDMAKFETDKELLTYGSPISFP